MSLTIGLWAVASLLPFFVATLTIPGTSTPAHGLAPRAEPASGICLTGHDGQPWCGVDGYDSGCNEDGVCGFFVPRGSSCQCEDPHRELSSYWGEHHDSFNSSDVGCEGEKGDIAEDVPINDDNALIKWCNAGRQIPPVSIVAGTYEGTMIYVCNFLYSPIGCDHQKEVEIGMDNMIEECGWGTPGWAFSKDWNKSYGMAKNGSDVCTNIYCTEPLYIDEDGEIHEGDCQAIHDPETDPQNGIIWS